jgi:hypothetical protein
MKGHGGVVIAMDHPKEPPVYLLPTKAQYHGQSQSVTLRSRLAPWFLAKIQICKIGVVNLRETRSWTLDCASFNLALLQN